MYDLIVIGGGPAGLTATMYAIKKRLNVLLLSKDLGGKTNYRLSLPWIKDYEVIRGLEVINKFRNELEYLDFARHIEAVDRVCKNNGGYSVVLRSGTELDAKAIIVATGAKQQLLRVPGEKEFMMKGLCYSALSYAPLFIDRNVIVVGDGDLALRSAGELSTIAEKVHLVCEEDKFLESALGKKLTAAENVEIHSGYHVTEIQGIDFAERLVLEAADGKKKVLPADGMFIEKNLIPNSQIVSDLVDLDENGRIRVDCGSRSSAEGIFAAGDVTTIYAEQVLIAVGEGAKAALSAYDYLLPIL